jgi:hypothetical protein
MHTLTIGEWLVNIGVGTILALLAIGWKGHADPGSSALKQRSYVQHGDGSATVRNMSDPKRRGYAYRCDRTSVS